MATFAVALGLGTAMAKLVVTVDDAVLGYYFLDKERFIIGRQTHTDLQIDEPGVSKEHAAILTVGNDQILEDLGSTNGTLVNGAKVERHILQNGDMIQIHNYSLKYINQKAVPDRDFDKTMILQALNREASPLPIPDNPALRVPGKVIGPVARSQAFEIPPAAIKGIKGPSAGKVTPIDRVLKTFGNPPDELAVILCRPHGYYISHVAGKTYPRVNGKSIGTTQRELNENDVIQVGGEELQFFYR